MEARQAFLTGTELTGACDDGAGCGLVGPLDVRLDGLALVVDPAVRPRLFDHGAQRLLPGLILRDLGPEAQRRLENPRGVVIRDLGGVGERAADRVEVGAFDHQLEGAKVVAVFERDAAAGRHFHEHDATLPRRTDQARSMTPASPSSVPNASSLPSGLQASAVTGASAGLRAKISAPS